MRLQQHVGVRSQHRDGLALRQRDEPTGQPPTPVVQLGVGEGECAIDDAHSLAVCRRRPV